MIALAENADDFGFCFPSIATLAQKTRCDERTVKRRIKLLELEGWVRIGRKVVNNKGNVYFIDLGKLGVTVSPDARISPLHLKFLKKSQDTVTPISAQPSPRFSPPQTGSRAVPSAPFFAPEKSGDTARFSGDNPQPGQGTAAEPQGTLAQGQMTPGAEIGDKLCPPNRKEPSVQPSGLEPSGEPSSTLKDTPLPPAGVSFPSLDANGRWDAFKARLKEDLKTGEISGGRHNFRRLQADRDDYDACFCEWWLRGAETTEHGMKFITQANEEAMTRAGLRKYSNRVKQQLRLFFKIPHDQTVDIVVVANDELAADAA